MFRRTDPEKVLAMPGKSYGHSCTWTQILYSLGLCHVTVTAWDVIAYLNYWRFGEAIRNKTAEKKGNSISIEEECDDEPGVAEGHDGADFLYTTRDPYWFSEEDLTRMDLNIGSDRSATASKLLDQLSPVKTGLYWVSERTILGGNFLTIKKEERKIKVIDVKGKKHVVQKPKSDKEGTDINVAKFERDVKGSEDVRINKTANDDRIKVSPSEDSCT